MGFRPCVHAGEVGPGLKFMQVCGVAVNVSRESMKVPAVDTSTESRVIGLTSGRGIRKDLG